MKILDFELGFNKVTPRSLKICQELGLLNAGGRLTKEEQDLIIKALETETGDKEHDGISWKALEVMKRKPAVDEMDIYLNLEKTEKLIRAVFKVTDEQMEAIKSKYDDIDVEILIQSTFEYLGKLQPFSLKSEDLLKILTDSMPVMGAAN